MVVLPFALLLLALALVLIGHRARKVALADDAGPRVSRALHLSAYCCLGLAAALLVLAGLLGYSLVMLVHYLPAWAVARLR